MKINRLVFGFLLLNLTSTMAQHGTSDHKHASTHGGIVKTAGTYHLELLQQAGALTVYLLDANQKTLLVTRASATALLQTADGKVTTIKLSPTAKNQFVATLDKAKTFHKVVVTVALGGKTVSASFDLIAPKTADAHTTHKQ